MASSPPAYSSFSSMETSLLWEISDLAPDDIFLCARPKQPKRRLLQVAKTCYTPGSEQDVAKDGKQDISASPNVRSNKHSHDHACILQMNTPGLRSSAGPVPPTWSSSHVVGDVSLFSPSFRFRTATTTPENSAAAAAVYPAHDGRVLTVAGIGTVSCDNFRIPNARCVPDLCTGLNLVSVQQLADCGYLVVFCGGQCSVMEQSCGKIVGKGRLHADDGLYHLEFLNILRDKACEDSIKT